MSRPAVGGKDTKAAAGDNLFDSHLVGCDESLISVVVNTGLALTKVVKSGEVPLIFRISDESKLELGL